MSALLAFFVNLILLKLKRTNHTIFSSAGLEIPRPPTELLVPQAQSTSNLSIATTGSRSMTQAKNLKRGKPMVASSTLLTPRCVRVSYRHFPYFHFLNVFLAIYLPLITSKQTLTQPPWNSRPSTILLIQTRKRCESVIFCYLLY